MTETRRTVARWLLAAFLETGEGRSSHHWEVARIERPVRREELRARLGPYSTVRFLPTPARR